MLGDPCGHRNAVFFDAVQCGLDGYGSAFFAGVCLRRCRREPLLWRFSVITSKLDMYYISISLSKCYLYNHHSGTNAIFRRAALDSIGGIRYGTLTEDAFTGRMLNEQGWDSAYFRKDWEGHA